jgi:asparagine synthase (glutamine-hydrolysing)
MYAFAWLNAEGTRLMLARDHAGMKPLYLWKGPQGIAFASEIRALGALVRTIGGSVRVNSTALSGFLAWGSVPEPMTVLAGAEMLSADCAIEIDVRDASRTRTHEIGARPLESADSTGERAIPEVRASLRSAIRRHLVADHPVALFLSSGIDSGGLAVEMARANAPHPQAISVVLQADGTKDEPAIVSQLATRLGISLHIVPVADWHRRLSSVLEAYDQPSIDGMNTFLVSGVAAELGYRVALSGVGADEVFGGYNLFHQRANATIRLVTALAGPNIGSLLTRQHDPRLRRFGMLAEGAAVGERMQRSWRRMWSDSQITRLLPGFEPPRAANQSADPLRLEQDTYLRDTLLRDTDVMGMAHSVEIRAPFLDPEVLQSAANVGTATLLRANKAAKWVLREAWDSDLEASTLARPKSGFTLDVARWLREGGGPLLDKAYDELTLRACIDQRVFRPLWHGWRARLHTGHASTWTTLFGLVQLNEQFSRWGEPG